MSKHSEKLAKLKAEIAGMEEADFYQTLQEIFDKQLEKDPKMVKESYKKYRELRVKLVDIYKNINMNIKKSSEI